MKSVVIFTKYRFIGDTLVAIPTMRAAREAWPDAHITVLSGARACELLKNCPYIDDFLEFDPYRASNQGIPQYLRLVFALQRQRFDLALVLNRSFHSALTSALGGIGRRAGWSGFQGRDFLLTDRCSYDFDRSEIDCCLDILSAVTHQHYPHTQPELWVTEEERGLAALLLPDQPKCSIIGIQPGASHESKRWPASSFAALIEKLVESDASRKVVLLGGSEEKVSAEAVTVVLPDLARAQVTDLTGVLDLRGSLGVLSQTGYFIGNDTAVRHAAVALGTPSLGIFGPTNSNKWGNSQPPLHQIIRSRDNLMESISVDEVYDCVATSLEAHACA